MSALELEEIKSYCRVDYHDDDGLLYIMRDAVLEEMKDLIPRFDREHPTARQKLLILAYIKDLYDNRDAAEVKKTELRYAVRSMLLQESLK